MKYLRNCGLLPYTINCHKCGSDENRINGMKKVKYEKCFDAKGKVVKLLNR